MGMFTEWRDDAYAALQAKYAKLEADYAALVAEFQRLADEPPTLEEIATDLDKIEMLGKELAERDKLIEQMRGALTKLIGTLEVMSVMPETLGKCPVLAIDAPELEQARAALAAERISK